MSPGRSSEVFPNSWDSSCTITRTCRTDWISWSSNIEGNPCHSRWYQSVGENNFISIDYMWNTEQNYRIGLRTLDKTILIISSVAKRFITLHGEILISLGQFWFEDRLLWQTIQSLLYFRRGEIQGFFQRSIKNRLFCNTWTRQPFYILFKN